MTRRLVRQLLYGAFYLAIFYFIGWGLYAAVIQPAPSCIDNRQNGRETGIDCGGDCESCAIKTLRPLQVSWTRYFAVGDRTVVVAELKNPNPEYGADQFSYTLRTTGGAAVETTHTSFVYGGEIKYLFHVLSDTTSVNDADITIIPSGMRWKSLVEFPRPSTQVRGITTGVADRGLAVSGYVANTGAAAFSSVKLIALLYNTDGTLVGASQTTLTDLAAFDERAFHIGLPSNLTLLGTTPLVATSSAASAFSNMRVIDPSKTRVYVEAIK